MLEESKHFNKRIVMTKIMMKILRLNIYVDGDIKIRDHCHITGKYKGFVYKNCNVKVNHKNTIVFHYLKNYNSHLIMQKLDKFDYKINVILNIWEKYVSLSINNILTFIDSFQFLSSSFLSLVKNLIVRY